MPVHIGTSGWHYDDWSGHLYPTSLPRRSWLEHYAGYFETVEINNAFYRLPEVSTFERWRDATPNDFVFAVKASRYLTHVKRLHDPSEPVARLMERARHLGPKLGPVLVQLPANLSADPAALRGLLDAFPPGARVAFEPRHMSWHTDEVAAILSEHDAALCLTDTAGRLSPIARTATWGYVRFHEGRAAPHPCYGRRALKTWAVRLARLWTEAEDVYVYFNNDRGGCAVRDAHRFGVAVAGTGLSPTRLPSAVAASLIRKHL